MQRSRILVIDDDAGLVDVLSMALSDSGFSVAHAHDGAAGWRAFGLEAPDLVLLDVMMPEMDGLEVCRRIRAKHDVPIIMLTSRDEELDMVLGLEMGADDYITKPFSTRVLIARIRAQLRRHRGELGSDHGAEQCTVGALHMDRGRREIKLGDGAVLVTATEFELLWTLAQAPGRVRTRAELIEAVYGRGVHVSDRTIDTFVKRLRRKLRERDDGFDALETVRSIGYRYRQA